MRARPETDGGPAHADFADLYGATPEIIVNARTYRLMAVEVLVPRSADVAAGAEGTAILQEAPGLGSRRHTATPARRLARALDSRVSPGVSCGPISQAGALLS